MKLLLSFLICSLSLNFCFAVTSEEKNILNKIQKEYPKLNIEDAVFLPNVNLYELHSKKNTSLVYTNPTLNYFLISGEIIDAKNKKNITTDRELVNVQRIFYNLPTSKAIVVKYGKGTRKVAIFTDPNCPFCKVSDQDFHQNLKNQDITFYYYMNPLRIQGHENAPLIAKKIWCSEDKSKAWINWMDNEVLPTNAGTCSNPVAETKELSTSLGFNSTPTLILDNGYIWRGKVTSATLLELFNKGPAAVNPR